MPPLAVLGTMLSGSELGGAAGIFLAIRHWLDWSGDDLTGIAAVTAPAESMAQLS
jgi:hypothetical protein